jgi:ribosomal-protein-alanine N-acetyltransferase
MNRALNTARLRLRAPRPGDARVAFERWAQDALVLRYLGWRPHVEVEQTRQQLDWDTARWMKKSAFTWLLLPRGDPAPVGQVQLVPQSLSGPCHHLRLGYLLARSHQGRGLMREAVWRVDALCDVENLASARLLQSLGLQCEGRLARHALHPNAGAQPRDVWCYAAVRDSPATPSAPRS